MSLQKTEQNRPLAVLGEQQGKLSGEVESLVDRIFDQLLASCPSIQYWSEKASCHSQKTMDFRLCGERNPHG
ncbi:hypothetical protein V5G30_04720 [Mannheimia haemolytica]